jgi:hypothetical protein
MYYNNGIQNLYKMRKTRKVLARAKFSGFPGFSRFPQKNFPFPGFLKQGNLGNPSLDYLATLHEGSVNYQYPSVESQLACRDKNWTQRSE